MYTYCGQSVRETLLWKANVTLVASITSGHRLPSLIKKLEQEAHPVVLIKISRSSG